MLYLVTSEYQYQNYHCINTDIVKIEEHDLNRLHYRIRDILSLDKYWRIIECEPLTLEDIDKYLLQGDKYYSL